MAQITIEMNRGSGWEIRQQGATDCSADELAAMLPAYAIQYPHRAFRDGMLVATATRKRGKVALARHDG